MHSTVHRIVTTPEQIEKAKGRARQFQPGDRRVIKALFEAAEDRIALELADGVKVSIPRAYLQGLQGARRSELADIEILGRGTGLHWPRLDVDHYVPGLLNQVFGTRQWMSQLGQLGGASRSPAKRAAARANGRKGGRPKLKAKAS